MSDVVNVGGRPTKYRAEFPSQARELCALGATDSDLAKFFSVELSTLYLWKNQHRKFSEAIKQAKNELDAQVEKSLFQRATGYSHPDVDIKVVDGEIVQTPLTKHYPPDNVSMIFWLKNRQPDRWRDVQRSEILSVKLDLTHASVKEIDEELAKRAITLPD